MHCWLIFLTFDDFFYRRESYKSTGSSESVNLRERTGRKNIPKFGWSRNREPESALFGEGVICVVYERRFMMCARRLLIFSRRTKIRCPETYTRANNCWNVEREIVQQCYGPTGTRLFLERGRLVLTEQLVRDTHFKYTFNWLVINWNLEILWWV